MKATSSNLCKESVAYSSDFGKRMANLPLKKASAEMDQENEDTSSPAAAGDCGPSEETTTAGSGFNSSPNTNTEIDSLPHHPPPLLQHAESLPVNPSHHWSAQPFHQQQDESIDGFRATTLVGLGGLIGWTAAAAYRWLNGGEFSMFPPPPTNAEVPPASRELSASFLGRGHTLYDSRPGTENGFGAWNQHQNNYNRTSMEHNFHENRDNKLAEQVKTLVEALKQQSTENQEIMKRLARQNDTRQTDESIQRLREHSETGLNNNNSSAATAASMAIFCKLAEIQTELSSLRRDIKALPDGSEKWEGSLSSTLQQLQSCLSKMNQSPDVTKKHAETESSVDSTPVRTKASCFDGAGKSDTSYDPEEIGTHAVASALKKLVLENDSVQLRVGAQLLYLYAINLATHPNIPRYRKIFTSNESFQRVSNLSGGREILQAVGFKKEENSLVWQPGEDEEQFLPLLNEVASALGLLKSPGHGSQQELLEKASECLSWQKPEIAPLPSEFGTDANNNVPALKTPDPSILSPPATKKQIMPNTPAVSFSPPNYLDSSTASAADSFFADSNKNNSTEIQEPIENMTDANSVWK